jgi:hypothetical protein
LPLLLEGPSPDTTLGHLLRIQRARIAPLLQRLDPARFAARFVFAWGVAMRYRGDDGVRQALLDPTLDRLEPTSTDALRIMVARASLLYDLGELERSRDVIAPTFPPTFAPTFEVDTAAMNSSASLIAQAALIAARIAHRQGDAPAVHVALTRWREHLPFPELGPEQLSVDPADRALLTYLQTP